MKIFNAVSIPNPCSKNWNGMKPNKDGRFCGHCQHSVIDFTNMTDAKIKKYLLRNKEEKICGRLTNKQLGIEISKLNIFWSHLAKKIENKYKPSYLKTLLIICLTAGAFISGCRMHKPPRVGRVVSPSDNTF